MELLRLTFFSRLFLLRFTNVIALSYIMQPYGRVEQGWTVSSVQAVLGSRARFVNDVSE